MYDHKDIDKKWQKRWEDEGVFQAEDFSDKEKFYCLIEFPYPSGEGLHIGHPRSYTALDVIARKKRMEGFNVLYPIGWDAFGLPTENYAIKTGRKPQDVTKENTDTFRRQLKSLGLSFDWSREINTTDPEYYKWTQWHFLEFFKAGLAYKDKMPINWCLSCKIGLANEEVVAGECERCHGPVEKRDKEQWMIAITKYADRLLSDLDTVDYMPKIKKQQQDWIGKSEGAEIDFEVESSNLSARAELRRTSQSFSDGWQHPTSNKLKVFTTRPDTLFGATYMVLAPEHELVSKITIDDQKSEVEAYVKDAVKKSDIERGDQTKEKTGVFTGAYAINPANDEKIPIWVADYVMISYGTGAIMAVPAHDERDFEFAKKFDLEIKRVVDQSADLLVLSDLVNEQIIADEFCFASEGTSVNSDFLNGLATTEAKEKMIQWLEEKGVGKRAVNYKLRDWVFSRQRYWGEPIPLVHCDECAKPETVMAFHGWEGSATSDFFATLKNDLEGKGYEFVIGNAPNTEAPNFVEWMTFAESQLKGRDTSQMTLVGHSMGGHLVLKLAEKYQFKKIILVAPVGFNPSEDYFKQFEESLSIDELDVFKKYQNHSLDIEAVKKNVPEIRFLFSDNDKWITGEIISYYRDGFASESRSFEIVKGAGHFTQSDGYEFVPQLEALFSAKTGWVPVPVEDLPVVLPDVEKYEPTDDGESPLSVMTDWVNTECPNCGGPAKRETDTMPNWAGSSWYFLAYAMFNDLKSSLPISSHRVGEPDPYVFQPPIPPSNSLSNISAFTDLRRTSQSFSDGWQHPTSNLQHLKYWMPVDLYDGGMEHTTLHLLYSRFWNKFLFDQGYAPTSEPYVRRHSHGLILAEDGTKMSKSKNNGVSPDEVIGKFGADSLRVYELFIGPFEEPAPWSPNGLVGVRRFLDKAMKLAPMIGGDEPESITRALHKTIKKVTEDITNLRFNTAVAQMMTFVNEVNSAGQISERSLMKFAQILCPFAPHVANELATKLGAQTVLEKTDWPKFDEKMTIDDIVTIAVQVNGKLRGTIEAVPDISQADAIEKAMKQENVIKFIESEPKKIIYVKGKLINFVI